MSTRTKQTSKNQTSATNQKQKNQQQQPLLVVEYAAWQKTEDEYGNHYVVYKTGGFDNCYCVIELDEEGYLISKVVTPDKYDLNDPKQLCFGCDMCDGHDEAWFNTNQNQTPEEICRHREALITVLKRRRDWKNTEGKWAITFAAASSSERSSNGSSNSSSTKKKN